ncbi:MAG: tRNA (adenosine(37)-N6)-threonylcarbamoyltransferase complex dimerization subunit type 1 TsaB [Planctomycetota bacterium]|jgi:tRNA threonylcarbamoyladenosine biosynthesis protein TsaB
MQKCEEKGRGIVAPPLILAIESSGRLGSVGVAVGGQMLAETAFSGLMRHSAEIFPSICGLLEDISRRPADIEQVYISVGPGSFTGLRIAVALAKTMHLANGARIVAVSTMDVMAANAADYMKEKNVKIKKAAAILDAKRGQFYIAAYRLHSAEDNKTRCGSGNSHFEKSLADCLMTAPEVLEQFADKCEPIWLLGEGLVYYKDAFAAEGIHLLPEEYWRAKALKVHLLGWEKALAGQFADPLTLEPFYLRRPEAEEKWQKRNIP